MRKLILFITTAMFPLLGIAQNDIFRNPRAGTECTVSEEQISKEQPSTSESLRK